jgi:gamma-glutamylcyclotransferase (GGCT)/AIG2-like uncharacterized protein YtfP
MMPRPDEAPGCDLLFVYGTLRRGFERHHHLVRLKAKCCGKGEVAGKLFDLGCYPGARPSGREGEWIRGEVYQLRRPERDLRVLDEIEGFNPSAPERGEFVRETAEFILDNAARRRAWVYWLRGGVATTRRIASGDYAQWRGVARHCSLTQ